MNADVTNGDDPGESHVDMAEKLRDYCRLWMAAILRAALVVASVLLGPAVATAQDKPQLTVAVTAVSASGGGALFIPMMGAAMPYSWFLEPAYDPLMTGAPDGAMKPGLALEWGYGDKSQSFWMKLRPGVTFSTGEPVNAAAVKNWFEWFRGEPGSWGHIFKIIQSIDTPDDLTVVLKFKEPSSGFEYHLSQKRIGYVVSPKGTKSRDAMANNTFGAGPYVLDPNSTILGSSYVYNARTDYVGPNPPAWSKIILKVITDPAARLAAIRTGQVDVAMGDAETADAAKAAGLNVVGAPALWNGILLFDRAGQMLKPLGDVRVRQALQMAVDRKAVAEAIFGAYGRPNISTVTPSQVSYVPDFEERYAYNPKRAKELLREAGYPNGFTFDVLVYRRLGQEPLFAEALIGYYADIGVTLKIHQVERSEVVPLLKNHKYPAMVFFLAIEEADQQAGERLKPEATLNAFQYEDLELSEMYRKFAVSSPEARPQLQKDMMRRINEQATYATYTMSDALYYYNKRVKSVDISEGNSDANLATILPAR